MRKLLSFSTLFLLLCISSIIAQRTTGMIEGVITDEEGTPLPGVTVTIKGPAIASRSLSTDANGKYRFPALSPGEYAVAASIPGFKKYTQEKIPVNVEKTITLNITLEIGTIEEEITVVGESPIVDVTTSRLSTNVKKEYFDALPKGRSFQEMVYLAPSVQPDPWGIGIGGATSAENQYIIDGINTTEVETGIIGTNLAYDFIEEVQIKTGGYEAEFGGAMGGVVNVITKSGSNEIHGGAWFNYQTHNFYGTPEIGYLGQGAIDEFSYSDFGINFSGPIVKDKAWFFLGATPSFRTTHYKPTNSWTGETRTFNVLRNRYYFSGKFILEAAAGHKFTASFFGDPMKGEGDNPGTVIDFIDYERYGVTRYSGGTNNFALRYDGIFGNDLLVHAMGGLYYYKTKEMPKDKTKPAIYLRQGYLGAPDPYGIGGHGEYNDLVVRQRWQANLDITKYLGGHSIKAGVQFQRSLSLNEGGWTGGYLRQVRPLSGYFRDIWWSWEGESYTDILALFLQDSWKVTDRLTLNVGIRIEDQNIHAGDKALDFEPSESVIHWGFLDQISPRVGFAFDVFGDGTSKLFGSYGCYHEMVPLLMNTRAFGAESFISYFYPINLGDPLTFIPDKSQAFYEWTLGTTKEWPDPDRDDKGLDPQYVEEFIVGFEKQIATDFSLNIRGVWKRLGLALEDGSLDGGASFFFFNPGKHFVEGEINPITGKPREIYVDAFPEAKRDYKAVEIMLLKKFSHNHMFTLSYTYSRLRGNHPGLGFEEYTGEGLGSQLWPNLTALFDFPEFLYNADGVLPGDRPHQFKFDGIYVFSGTGFLGFLEGLSLGASFRFMSGKSLTKMGENENYLNVVFLEPRGSDGRLPNYYQLDFHAGYEVKIAGKYKIGVTLDVFNLLNTKIETRRWLVYLHDTYFGSPSELMPWDFSTTKYPTADNDLYGKTMEYQIPIRARLGLTLRF
ncbi:MAG: TonB-dependent receptor domain-containing protein [Candidatus Aminicenantaceae bacterium]